MIIKSPLNQKESYQDHKSDHGLLKMLPLSLKKMIILIFWKCPNLEKLYQYLKKVHLDHQKSLLIKKRHLDLRKVSRILKIPWSFENAQIWPKKESPDQRFRPSISLLKILSSPHLITNTIAIALIYQRFQFSPLQSTHTPSS